ncbi:mCG1036263 [Mus musculus]|nr:mCG1036263 [Mus musculus]
MVKVKGKGRAVSYCREHHFHISFTHRTKQTSIESPTSVVRGSPQTGCLGQDLVCFNPRGIRGSKAAWEGQTPQGWREEEVQGVGWRDIWQVG